MKNLFIFFTLLTSIPLPSQIIDMEGGTTRAVVIGISDYQDDGITDLRFAHRDAEAFVAWLRSAAGGSLPDDNIQLLLNEKATKAQFAAALDWLREQSKEGDQTLIYFSGHGDVDSKIIGQEGFLLFWDTPSQSYISGAYPLYFLKLVISTLSLQNKAKVVMIADACRAGKLAGSAIGGAQITNENLRQQFAHEIKILSCQPNEVSIESEQWGGGRGVFSYHLVDGMYGMADGNTDGQVTLSEMDRYLEDHVTKEAAPMRQTPMVIGDKWEPLAQVLPDVLALWKKGKEGQPVQFKQVEQRGLEDETLAKVDTSIRKLYFAFKRAVQEKVFLEPADSCANAYYEKLVAVAELKPLHGAMTRNFAAALQDDAQQWVNKYLQSTVFGSKWMHPKGYDVYLAKAAELLGEGHYLYGNLKGREYFFKARDVFIGKGGGSGGINALGEPFEQYLRQGLAYDDRAPYLYAHLTYRAHYSADRNDKLEAIELWKKAIELAPSWVMAHRTIGLFYMELGDLKAAKEWILKALALDVEAKDAYLGIVLLSIGEPQPALKYALKYHQRNCVKNHGDACVLYRCYLLKHQFEDSRRIGQEHIELVKKDTDPDLPWLGHCYWYYGSAALAEATIKEHLGKTETADKDAVKPEPDCALCPFGQLMITNLAQGDLKEAEFWWEKRGRKDAALNPGWYDGWGYGLHTWLAYTQGNFGEVDSLIELHSKEVPVDDLIEDMLLVISICNQVDYAIFILDKSRKYFPDDAPLRYHLARLHLEQKNDYEKGVPLLEKAVQLDSTHAYAHYHFAAAYAHLGKNKAALAYLEKALEKGYEDFEQMEKDARWERLRGTKKYKELVKKYQPEK